METMIAGLFDYQKYIGNPKLANAIDSVHASIAAARCLDDAEVDIWAAGESLADLPPTETRHD